MTTREQCEQTLAAITNETILGLTLQYLLRQIDRQDELAADNDATDLEE